MDSLGLYSKAFVCFEKSSSEAMKPRITARKVTARPAWNTSLKRDTRMPPIRT